MFLEQQISILVCFLKDCVKPEKFTSTITGIHLILRYIKIENRSFKFYTNISQYFTVFLIK